MKRLQSISLTILLVTTLGACTKTTKVEKEVTINPDTSVTDKTRVDQEVTTEVKVDDIEVKTQSN